MKIIAVSDLHIPKNDAKMPEMIRNINSSDADVLLLGGDIAPANDMALENFLKSISGFRGKKMYVAGNHDLWTTDGSSLDRHEKILPMIYRKYGFHSLEKEPVVYKDVGFAGNIGWFDYSFVRVYSPPNGSKFKRTVKGEPVGQPVSWQELTDEDFSTQAIGIMGMLGLKRVTGSNDIEYMHGIGTDKEFCAKLTHKLEEDIKAIEDSVKKIVIVMHCVPFKEGLARDNSAPEVCVRNAYAGSKRLGEVIFRHPKVSTLVWGHVHNRQKFVKGRTQCYNVSFDKTGSENPVKFEV